MMRKDILIFANNIRNYILEYSVEKNIGFLCYNKHLISPEFIDEINETNIKDVMMILKLEKGVDIGCNFDINTCKENEDAHCYFNTSYVEGKNQLSVSGSPLTINDRYEPVRNFENRIILKDYKTLTCNKEKIYMILDFYVKNNEVK